MSMSKKDFVALAKVINANFNSVEAPAAKAAIAGLANSIANVCWEANSAFNKSNFLAACGVKE